jgi:hypothetical protein
LVNVLSVLSYFEQKIVLDTDLEIWKQ